MRPRLLEAPDVTLDGVAGRGVSLAFAAWRLDVVAGGERASGALDGDDVDGRVAVRGEQGVVQLLLHLREMAFSFSGRLRVMRAMRSAGS